MPENLNFAWGTSASYANVGAVAGTGASFTSTAASNAVINGGFTTPMAPQTNAALPTVDAGTGLTFPAIHPNYCAAIVFGVNRAGQLQVAQGERLFNGGGTGIVPAPLTYDPQFPGLPNDFVPIAYAIIRTAPAAAAWLLGASAWTAAGVAVTPFRNVSQLPNRPQAG